MVTHLTHTRAAPTLLITWIMVLLLAGVSVGQDVRVTTLAEVLGDDGTDVTVPCSFTVTPAPTGDQDYVLRWIKYPEGGTFYNVYNYNGQGEFDGPVNKPAEGRYRRVNQDLVIPNFGLADEGKLCCEIVLLPDMTASDSNCTQVRYIDFDASAWKAVDKKNTSLITNPDYFITAIPPVTLEVNISYNEIYPPCDLSLYRRTTENGNDVLTLLDQKLQSQVTAVNGRYSLLMEAKQPVECIGTDVITRLVARLENCLITSPRYEAEQHFTVVCSDVDECLSDPCQDGGTCIDLINAYRCIYEPTTTTVNSNSATTTTVNSIVSNNATSATVNTTTAATSGVYGKKNILQDGDGMTTTSSIPKRCDPADTNIYFIVMIVFIVWSVILMVILAIVCYKRKRVTDCKEQETQTEVKDGNHVYDNKDVVKKDHHVKNGVGKRETVTQSPQTEDKDGIDNKDFDKKDGEGKRVTDCKEQETPSTQTEDKDGNRVYDNKDVVKKDHHVINGVGKRVTDCKEQVTPSTQTEDKDGNHVYDNIDVKKDHHVINGVG